MNLESRINGFIDEFIEKLKKMELDEVAKHANIERIVAQQEALRDKLKAQIDENNINIARRTEELDKAKQDYSLLSKRLQRELEERNLTLQTIKKDSEKCKESLYSAEKFAEDAKRELNEARKIKSEAQNIKDKYEAGIIFCENEKLKLAKMMEDAFRQEKDLAKRVDACIKKEMALNDYDTELRNRANDLKRYEKAMRYVKPE